MSRAARLVAGYARAVATVARAGAAPVACREHLARVALNPSHIGRWGRRSVSTASAHTSKWMQKSAKKSPMEFINEVPPIEVDGRIVACEGGKDPALGHPVEYINLDPSPTPAVCKYCGLRYVQKEH